MEMVLFSDVKFLNPLYYVIDLHNDPEHVFAIIAIY